MNDLLDLLPDGVHLPGWLTTLLGGGAGALHQLQLLAPALAIVVPTLVWVVGGLRIWSIVRVLRQRTWMAVIPTARYGATMDNVMLFARAISQVRMRRRRWWTQPAGAARFRLDTINGRAVIHSASGPPWMRSIINTNSYPGLMQADLTKIDLMTISPKGMLFPPEPDPDEDAPTWPGAARPLPDGGTRIATGDPVPAPSTTTATRRVPA